MIEKIVEDFVERWNDYDGTERYAIQYTVSFNDVIIDHLKPYDVMENWCKENLYNQWDIDLKGYNRVSILIIGEIDAMAFKLRWV